MARTKRRIDLKTRLEILVVAVIYIAGAYPPEAWPTSVYVLSGRLINENIGFVLTLIGVSILYITSVFVWADLFEKGLPGRFVSNISDKVLGQEKRKESRGLIVWLAQKVGGFRNWYKASNLDRHQRIMRVAWLLLLGALPGGFTLFAILVCASARYFRGIIPILLGFSVAIYLTTIGGVYIVDRVHDAFNASVDKLLSIIPFAISTSTFFILVVVAVIVITLHQLHKRNHRH